MAKKFGRATIRVNGTTLDTEKGSTLDPGGTKREPRPGSNTTSGFTEELVPAKIEATILFGEGDSLTDLNALINATVLFETDTGQTYIVRDAYCAEPVTLTEGEGKAKLVLMGSAAEEMR
ncbi:phage tail tube protein [Brevundimonas vitis]|uniref:Phage tail tube protein n=1 Tax=Brevundimonas vitisensis TaxID=2800818 RepID=A0ABX7BQ28_9CAUL|nr:phage tail tube protein [Brevundimonas vitisensis]QQQ19670.1 phage tail tube protein [Brevundimonas vitisensis]